MERRRAGRCRLALDIHPCGHGDGYDGDAACACGWAWIGWAELASSLADEAAGRWSEHRNALESLRGRNR